MLYALKSLPVVREVYRSDALPPIAGDYRRDTITLGWEDRVRARGRRRSDNGVEFGTALERGTVLRDGDWLLLDGLATAIGVVARAEAVLVIEARTPAEAVEGYSRERQAARLLDEIASRLSKK